MLTGNDSLLMCIEDISVHKKVFFFIFMNHADMYINVYKSKCNRGFVGKEMLVNGKWDEKWDNGSEYVVSIVPPPQLNWLHVPMQLGAGHGS